MKKKLFILPLLAFTALLGACDTMYYTPKQGGQIDTLHNEIHVTSKAALDALPEDQHGKDASKVYYTDNDGLKYQWNVLQMEYVCISEYNTTINFYFDHTQTTGINGNDLPLLSVRWYMKKPLEVCPSEVDSEEKVLALGRALGFELKYDFVHFIGFSLYPTCLDESKLWDFSKDVKLQSVTNLYGIWVD